MASRDPPIYEELSEPECLALLERAPVGRVGISIQALPAVLPVNYVVVGRDVVFRTVPGTKLDAATTGTVVAFEADHYDPERRDGWSVLVRGVAHEVTDDAELAGLRALPLEPWALDGEADRFVRVTTTMMSGRRIRRRHGARVSG